ncbi:MAG: hypothetical protein K5900_12465 [Butyrivibrio sp.]|nr:hypothetical protein [Butyrivibrio sp.]
MGSFYSAVMTNAGAELLTQALAGTATIEFTSMKTGNGTYEASERTTAALQERTALKSLKQSFEFTGSATVSDTGIALAATITNEDVVEGYYIQEVGIYARNAQVVGSTPILYSIAVAEVADYLPPYNGSAPTTITQSYYVTVSNSASVQIVIADGAYTLNYDEDNSKLQLLLDGEVVSEVEIQGGGTATKSTLTLWTSDPNMYGATGTVVIAGTTYNFTLPAAGGSINLTIRQTGTATITATKEEFSFESTLSMQTFTAYNQEITSGDAYTINITTEETALYGQTVTATYDTSSTKTATLSESGTATITLYNYTGNVTLTATDGTNTATSDITIVEGTSSYACNLSFGDAYTINITTEETTLYGQTVTATYDTSRTKTATLSSSGTATITLYNYTGLVVLSSTDGEETAEENVTIVEGTSTYTAELSFAKIYGISWDGSTSTTWTRTDASAEFVDPSPAVNNGDGSSPFDDIQPWAGMEIVDDATVGKLVKIPKYYFKWTKTGSAMTLQVSTKQYDGFICSPAHADRGDGTGERDYVYVARYHCATSTYKSTTGVKPMVSKTRAEFRTGIHNLDSDIWQYDFAMYWTIMMLYLVEYADWNSQNVIGYGCGNGSATENAGSTDVMTYHTGTNASSRTTYGHVQYRHIEDLWANVRDFCDGIYFSGVNIYCIKNPADFSDTTGGTLTGTRSTTSNCIKSFAIPSASGFEYALYPDETVSDSNYATYVCDQCYYDSSGVVLNVGGSCGQNQVYGAFYLGGHYTASGTDANLGSRLQKLPV